ncbi:MAG: WYL domain-containing protein [Candidatus Obscuribacter sp.]|nr:WYL domain-containing protein [Candidatus Obscuribacter sp.]
MASKLERTAIIIKIIANAPGITMSRLHAELQARNISVSERTLAKDIDSLKKDYKLLPDKDRLRQGYYLKDVLTLSVEEAEVALDALHLLGTRLKDKQAETLAQRLQTDRNQNQFAPEPAQAAPRRTRTLSQRNILSAQRSEDIQRQLNQAIRQTRPVTFTYKTPRLKAAETVSGFPLLMVFHERGWYCIMRNLTTCTYSPRRIDRISDLKLIEGGKPNRDAQENIDEAGFLLSSGWGMSFPKNLREYHASDSEPYIVARFEATVAPYILEATERHPRGKVKACRDGTGDVEFSIKLHDPRGFLDWVRSFGAKARIIAPKNLVEKEKAELKRLLLKYEAH